MEGEYPWEYAWNGLRRSIEEDVESLEKLVNDEDSSCPARDLRRERISALKYVLCLMEVLSHWDW